VSRWFSSSRRSHHPLLNRAGDPNSRSFDLFPRPPQPEVSKFFCRDGDPRTARLGRDRCSFWFLRFHLSETPVFFFHSWSRRTSSPQWWRQASTIRFRRFFGSSLGLPFPLPPRTTLRNFLRASCAFWPGPGMRTSYRLLVRSICKDL